MLERVDFLLSSNSDLKRYYYRSVFLLFRCDMPAISNYRSNSSCIIYNFYRDVEYFIELFKKWL